MYVTLLWTPLRFLKICKPLVVYRFDCMALFHTQMRRHMIKQLTLVKVMAYCKQNKEHGNQIPNSQITDLPSTLRIIPNYDELFQ